MRLRSDEQLVALFRAGNEEAFRVVHDRYRQRLFAYCRQMLPGSRQDAEDALQDVFVRAYGALRASQRPVSLRAWLYRVAHNRCIDELRRPPPPPAEVLELVRPPEVDPLAEAERRESLRRLVTDVRRLPDQQRSALLMREMAGMPYAELAETLDVTVPAVKSLLVRARVGLAQAGEARDTACHEIRGELSLAHDRGVRASGMARRHLRDCDGCRAYRGELRSMGRSFGLLVPALGPLGWAVKALGLSGGSAAAGSGAAAAGGGAAGGVALGHVAAVVAAAVVTAGGAVEIQQSFSVPHHAHHRVAPFRAPAAALPAVIRAADPATSRALVAPSRPQATPPGRAPRTAPASRAAASTPAEARGTANNPAADGTSAFDPSRIGSTSVPADSPGAPSGGGALAPPDGPNPATTLPGLGTSANGSGTTTSSGTSTGTTTPGRGSGPPAFVSTGSSGTGAPGVSAEATYPAAPPTR